MTFPRFIKYHFLRILRLKGDPHELALGMSLGIFSGMMPVIPFHMALAVALALFFKVSKITAAIGCWVSNPFNVVFIYVLNYRIGAFILGLSENNKNFSAIIDHIRHGEEGIALIKDIMSASSSIIGTFLLGGIIMGIVTAVPSYFIFLNIFRYVKKMRERRKGRGHWRKPKH